MGFLLRFNTWCETDEVRQRFPAVSGKPSFVERSFLGVNTRPVLRRAHYGVDESASGAFSPS
tara:strand:- start:546 stop:731 length:186 start_codon:yes stop_codon:yes gene_type:complete